MSDPIRLPIARVKNRFDPHPPLVKMLEDLLALAKEGKVQGVAVAVVYHDHLDAGGEVGEGWQSGDGTRYALSHAIGRLQAKWFHDVLRSSGDI